MGSIQGVAVSYAKFISELTNEFNSMQVDGTSYRKETAELSLFAAKQVGSVYQFFNRKVAYKTVQDLLPAKDEERLKDITKMLNVVLLDLHSKANQSDEFKARLAARARKRGELKLVPM